MWPAHQASAGRAAESLDVRTEYAKRPCVALRLCHAEGIHSRQCSLSVVGYNDADLGADLARLGVQCPQC